jgi:hypothetical protein
MKTINKARMQIVKGFSIKERHERKKELRRFNYIGTYLKK